MSESGKGDAEKARYWQRTISEAAQSGDIDSAILSAASVERESVLLVAAQAQGQSAGRDDVETRWPRATDQFCSGERGLRSDGRGNRVGVERGPAAAHYQGSR